MTLQRWVRRTVFWARRQPPLRPHRLSATSLRFQAAVILLGASVKPHSALLLPFPGRQLPSLEVPRTPLLPPPPIIHSLRPARKPHSAPCPLPPWLRQPRMPTCLRSPVASPRVSAPPHKQHPTRATTHTATHLSAAGPTRTSPPHSCSIASILHSPWALACRCTRCPPALCHR